MPDLALKGKRIAVVVDNLFIPEEIVAYRDHFERLGANVELVTRRYNQPERVYFGDAISDLEPTPDPGEQKQKFPLATFDDKGIPTATRLDRVSALKDFEDVSPNQYAAVLTKCRTPGPAAARGPGQTAPPIEGPSDADHLDALRRRFGELGRG